MKDIVFLLCVLGGCVTLGATDDSTPITIDELYFGDYNKAVNMTPSEAMKFSEENNTIVIFFSKKMSPSAVEFTNDFLENRGYDVTLASGLKPPLNQEKQAVLGVFVAGLIGGVFEAHQIDDGSAYVQIIRKIERAEIKPDPNKIVDLYTED